MSDLSGHAGTERLTNYVLGRFDIPPYARRARDVSEAYETLLARCRRERERLLGPLRDRFARLRAGAGAWARLSPWLADESQLGRFYELESLLSPTELPGERTVSDRAIRRAARTFVAAAHAFNRSWQEFIDQLDLGPINALREGYNRFYLLEKECALRSAKLARVGYVPLAPVAVGDVLDLFPLLPVPLLRP